MSLEKSSITWSAKQLKGMVINGKIDFDHIVQRSYVWERSRKTGLIESMIIGYPIPPIYAKRFEDGSGNRTYQIMDGKQRLSTVKEYMNDEFALTDIPAVRYMDEETGEEMETNISDLKFSELPEALRDYLNAITFNITYFDNLTKEEERELFKRLNAGKPLSTKSRVLASCKDIEEILNIGEHEIFAEMLTDKAISNKNQVGIVMKAWSMLNQNIDEICFESKKFNPMIEETEISEAQKEAMNAVFDFALEIHAALADKDKKLAKKFYTETHFISFIPFISKANQMCITADLFADFVIDFFTNESEMYAGAAGASSAKNGNIKLRNQAIQERFEQFFQNDEPFN